MEATTEEPKKPDDGKTGQPNQADNSRNVTLAVTVGENTTRKSVRFHTPTLLKEVQALDDAASVEIIATGRETPETLLQGTKAEAVKMLESSIVKPEQLIAQFQHLVRFLVDHSDLKAVGVELICLDDKGDTAGTGFVSTTPDCTVQQAIALVNCGDANMDEFATKAKLNIPGRNGNAEKGTIVVPTPEQIQKLG